MRQREGYEQDREKARERIAASDKETLLSADERTDRMQLENAKIQDAEAKITRVDEQIRNNARLIDAQKQYESAP